MLTSIQISGFRGFSSLAANNLGRVNLFVGTNNCGKTSLLEAIELLAIGEKERSVTAAPWRRHEMSHLSPNTGMPGAPAYLDVVHLFHGHTMELGKAFSITADGGQVKYSFAAKIAQATPDMAKLFGVSPDSELARGLEGTYSGPGGTRHWWLALLGGTAVGRSFEIPGGPAQRAVSVPVNFVTSESLDSISMAELWEAIVLTEEEDEVIEALRMVNPDVERIASLAGRPSHGNGVGGFVVKLKGGNERLPLGTMGDGVRRLLAISLATIRSAGGFLLIDEIDTGLHYSVMTKLWKTVIATATRLDVQVFATTHSLDCIRSLAWLYKEDPELCGEVRVHRIKQGREQTIAYTAQEIAVAERELVEIR